MALGGVRRWGDLENEGGNVMKHVVYVIGCILISGCSDCNEQIHWRTDIAPIVKRVPNLSACTNILWHGEILTKNSLIFSVPGPSAYRVVCFVPSASSFIPPECLSALNVVATIEHLKEDEWQVVKNLYSIGSSSKIKVGKALTRHFIISPYWGECFYFEKKDLLIILLFGEN